MPIRPINNAPAIAGPEKPFFMSILNEPPSPRHGSTSTSTSTSTSRRAYHAIVSLKPAGAPAKPAPSAPPALLSKCPPRRLRDLRRIRAALAALLTAACGSIPAVSEPLPARPAVNQFDSADQTRLGVQVKIETFTADNARAISKSGFTFVRLGVWTNSLNDPEYLK